MLSRVAEALFWIGRYVERAEDTARLLDVHFHEVLEDPSVDEAGACAVLLTVMGVPDDTARRHRDSRAVLELLGYDEATPNSIVGALVAARENARGAREALSAEIWECLNSTYNALPARVAAARDFGPAPFFSYVRERAATFAGYVEASMSRDASHDVLVLGRSLERVDMTARLLAARIGAGDARRGLDLDPAGVLRPRRLPAHLPAGRRRPRGCSSSCWSTGSSPGRSSTRCAPGRRRWPGSTRRPGGPHWTNPPAGRSAGPAPTSSSCPPPSLLDDLPDRLHGLQRTVSTVSEEVTRRLFAGSAPLQLEHRGAAPDELADRRPPPHRLPVRRAGAGVVQRGAADPAEPSTGSAPCRPRSSITPAVRPLRYVDYWGTTVDAFDVHVPHTELVVLATSTVETARPRPAADRRRLGRPGRPGGPGPLRRAARRVAVRPGGAGPRRARAVAARRRRRRWRPGCAPPRGPTRRCATSGARRTCTPRRPRPAPPGRGVCQDFAHVTLALLRAVGLPARYVSGYLHPTADAEIGETTAGREPRLGGVLGRRLGRGRPDQPRRRGQPARAAGPRPRLRRRTAAVRRLLRPGRGALRRDGRGHPARLTDPSAMSLSCPFRFSARSSGCKVGRRRRVCSR